MHGYWEWAEIKWGWAHIEDAAFQDELSSIVIPFINLYAFSGIKFPWKTSVYLTLWGPKIPFEFSMSIYYCALDELKVAFFQFVLVLCWCFPHVQGDVQSVKSRFVS